MLFIVSGFGNRSSEFDQLTVHLENVQTTKGKIVVGIYIDSDSWSKRTPIRECYFSKQDLKEGRMTIKVPNLAYGTYGLAFLDDTNGNSKIDFGLLLPKEGFGFSNYYHSSFLLPRFDDFKFQFPRINDVHVKFRYLTKTDS
ncbi:DUF2141 domain-containing protein [Reichenbachiella versicolor]|uniref:DUF2141 domain-containing protein n=1 Tax=Reichenbachiella versicolor TaxID=1821036 RepID=UPI000D6E6351|nr:DUF2141 domain-containing protein [Reichenbachiella versicolor]